MDRFSNEYFCFLSLIWHHGEQYLNSHKKEADTFLCFKASEQKREDLMDVSETK